MNGPRTAGQIAADLTANNPHVAAALAPLSVPCPFCRAPRGGRCQTPRHPSATRIHAQRRNQVVHLATDADRIAAYAEVLAEQEKTRRAVSGAISDYLAGAQ